MILPQWGRIIGFLFYIKITLESGESGILNRVISPPKEVFNAIVLD
jgi:hypothetical protein